MNEFVEMKTADLVGSALDWAVAKAVGRELQIGPGAHQMSIEWFPGIMQAWSASNNWYQGGPLLHDYGISVIAPHSDSPEDSSYWAGADLVVNSTSGTFFEGANSTGDTFLIAACRAIVASVLGETVSVPKELLS